jgi:hypothetical protein
MASCVSSELPGLLHAFMLDSRIMHVAGPAVTATEHVSASASALTRPCIHEIKYGMMLLVEVTVDTGQPMSEQQMLSSVCAAACVLLRYFLIITQHTRCSQA